MDIYKRTFTLINKFLNLNLDNSQSVKCELYLD